jgi:hypothetical protein
VIGVKERKKNTMNNKLLKKDILEKECSMDLYSYYILDLGNIQYRFKIHIERNDYDFQSCAIGSILSNGEWKSIYSIPYPLMNAIKDKINRYQKEKCEKCLLADEKEILKMVEILLS